MPITNGTKLAKGDRTDSKKQSKLCARSSAAEKTASGNENTHCVDCGKVVLKFQAGITCDVCGFWHHAECEEVSDEVYGFLCDHSDDASLAWYCKKCVVVSNKLAIATAAICDQQQQMDLKVGHLKSDICGKMEQMKLEMQELRGMISTVFQKPDTRDNNIAVKEKVTELVAK